MSTKVAFSAPHHLAADVGLNCLKDGSNAVDAMVAAAASIAVLYPHMNSLAGDGFWLIHKPGSEPVAIDACGASARLASREYYRQLGFSDIPTRGHGACVTTGGTVAGWQLAQKIVAKQFQQQATHTQTPLKDLLAPAIHYAKSGIEVTESFVAASDKFTGDLSAATIPTHSSLGNLMAMAKLADFSEFNQIYAPSKNLVAKDRLQNADLASSLEQLSKQGLNDFYRGDLANHLGRYFADTESPIRVSDLQQCVARQVKPLVASTRFGQLYNLPAPTQGLASLLILSIYDRLYHDNLSEQDSVHYLIEATKQAFMVRDKVITDPKRMTVNAQDYLDNQSLSSLIDNVHATAKPWPHVAEPGDTVWMGCVDADGLMVSFIQSIYWEFGSGIVIPKTGIVWNNRGSSFNLESGHHNMLQPESKPLHTLNPALALLNDGRRMVYGSMGGEGQPQTQAAIFTRKIYQGKSLSQAIDQGRWLLGRTWGDKTSDLKMEQDCHLKVGDDLEARGHKITVVPKHSEIMGHAGAIVVSADKDVECASDVRSDGAGKIAELLA